MPQRTREALSDLGTANNPPDSSEFNKVCQLCFPHGYPVEDRGKMDGFDNQTEKGVPEEIADELGASGSSSSVSSDWRLTC